MLSLIAEITESEIEDAEALVDFFWNVDAVGNASGDIDAENPINGAPLRLYPGAASGPSWGEGEWGQEGWGTNLQPGPSWGETGWGEGSWGRGVYLTKVAFETPSVHFGRVKIAARARDQAGNAQGGSLAETEQTVNSPPRPPTRFKRGDYADARQWFTFKESPQLVA